MHDDPCDRNHEGLHDQPVGKPYPSWDEVVTQIQRQRTPPASAPTDERSGCEWHDLVADMIAER